MARRARRTQPFHRTLPLWPCQHRAVEAALSYADHFEALSENVAKPSMVVCMPTGSGKTAVIGTLARCVPRFGTTVVVSPRIAITDQLYREVSGRLFVKLGLDAAIIPKTTLRLVKPHAADLDGRELDDLVVFMTIQQLQRWHEAKVPAFERLLDSTSLLIFDEGHYEPAPAWSETVRAFTAPRLVFTATPYRNDLRLFAADVSRSYFYSFDQAVEDRVIRDVEFRELDGARSPERFVERLIDVYETDIGPLDDTDDRIIVRCDSIDSIHQLKAAVEAQGLTCLAVHERITTDPNVNEFRRVPDPSDVDARVWIHQYKLIEGVDDPRFRLLGIYDGFGSVRSVVQQVGRVTRNPENAPGQKAFVLDGTGRRLASDWTTYRKYDSTVRQYGFDAVGPEAKLIGAIAEALPPVLYLDRRFRVAADLENFNPEHELQLPCSAIVYHASGRSFPMDQATQLIVSELVKADRFVSQPVPSQDGAGFVLFSVRVANSRLLTDSYFLEPKLAVTVVWKVRRFICLFDSLGFRPPVLPGAGRPVEAVRLRRLLADGAGGTVTGVNLVNSSVSGHSLRAKSLDARSIAEIPGGFDDHAYVARHATGFLGSQGLDANKRTRRYLGFSRARVRDGGSKYVQFPDYLRWLDGVCQRLGARSAPDESALDRFARPLDSPVDPEPRSVLLDLAAVQDHYVVNATSLDVDNDATAVDDPARAGDDLDIEDLASAVDEEGQFKILANGVELSIGIRWDDQREIYELDSREISRRYRPTDADYPDLVQWLNTEQAFRVVPREQGVVYAHGEFYAPRVRFGPDDAASQRTLFRAIRPFRSLDQITSEKGTGGTLARNTGWEAESLFGLIDALGGKESLPDGSTVDTGLEQLFEDTTLLVCDDMGTEMADFVMLQEDAKGRRRIIFIHAKAKRPADRALVSASDLNEVCGQAIKNLAEMSQYAGTTVDRTAKWDGPWRMTRGGQPWAVNQRVRTIPRARRGQVASPGSRAWAMVRDYVEDPLCEREVWLFTANILSSGTLHERVTATANPALETVQAVYCIYSAMTAAASANTRLYVFCGE